MDVNPAWIKWSLLGALATIPLVSAVTATLQHASLAAEKRQITERYKELAQRHERLRAQVGLIGREVERWAGLTEESMDWLNGFNSVAARDLRKARDSMTRPEPTPLAPSLAPEVKAILLFVRDHADRLAFGARIVQKIPNLFPAYGPINSNYGHRTSPWSGENRLHKGIDIAANFNTPVIATAEGKVVHAGYRSDYGRYVLIDHALGFRTRYAHLNTLHVKKGERVRQGQLVGAVGRTGKATGTHLHYEVLLHRHHINPIPFVPKLRSRPVLGFREQRPSIRPLASTALRPPHAVTPSWRDSALVSGVFPGLLLGLVLLLGGLGGSAVLRRQRRRLPLGKGRGKPVRYWDGEEAAADVDG